MKGFTVLNVKLQLTIINTDRRAKPQLPGGQRSREPNIWWTLLLLLNTHVLAMCAKEADVFWSTSF